jgi:hypothetical protein
MPIHKRIALHYVVYPNPPVNAGGVNAHTSDHDVCRLNWLLKMPLPGTRIGVLRNSARGDHNTQMGLLNGAAAGRCVLKPKDINSNFSLQDLFNQLHGNIDALLVAADPFFNNNRTEVVKTAANQYPAIFQWCEFVAPPLQGLMSYGPVLSQCYDHAGAIAVQILNGTVNPPYPIWSPSDPNDFELCVIQARAMALNMWPLPAAITTCPQYKPQP